MARVRQESMEGICTVCREVMEIFSIGVCDHVICFKCATRMRVLCGQNECAICRGDMPQVVFSSHHSKFTSFNLKQLDAYRKCFIFFESVDIKKAFNALLEFRCKFECGVRSFRTFSNLRDHMRKEHNQHYCDICVNHLKIFPEERKLYDRKQLAEHRRKGDPDDLSHKGHPLCEFCEDRFLDKEELYKHLRKEHFYCHFCDADGITNEFYGEYRYLRDHFQKDHFLCEEDECAETHFTHAFRSDIDLRAHQAKEHTRDRKRAKQTRTLDIEVNLAPRPAASRRRQRPGAAGFNEFSDDSGDGSHKQGRHQRESARQRAREETDTALALAASLADAQRSGNVSVVDKQLLQPTLTSDVTKTSDDEYTERPQDFPSIHGQSAAETSPSTSPRPGRHTLANRVAIGARFSVQHGEMDTEDFPDLHGDRAKPKSLRMRKPLDSRWVQPPSIETDYPQLSRRDVTAHPARLTLGGQSAQGRPQTQAKSLAETLFKSNRKHDSDSSSNSLSDYPSLASIGSSLAFPLYDAGMSTAVTSSPPAKKKIPKKAVNRNQNPPVSIDIPVSKPKVDLVHKTVNSDVTKAEVGLSEDTAISHLIVHDEKTSKSVKTNNTHKNVLEEDFPTLSGSSAVQSQANNTWFKVKGSHGVKAAPTKPVKKATKAKAKPKPVSSWGGEDEQKDEVSWNLEEDEMARLVMEEEARVAREVALIAQLNLDAESDDTAKKCDKKKKKKNNRKKDITPQESSAENIDENGTRPSKLPSQSTAVAMTENNKINNGATLQSRLVEHKEPPLACPPGFNPVKSVPSAATKASAPPGFTANSSSAASSLGPPPPGFLSLKGAFPATSKQHEYVKPADFGTRNQALITSVMDLLDGDDDKFNKFKLTSGQFRRDVILAVEYYSSCCELFSRERFLQVFPELVVLLPDIQKQAELLKAHRQASRAADVIRISAKSDAWGGKEPFEQCAVCSQVLLRRDLTAHASCHTGDEDFPSLGGTAGNVPGMGAWVRAM